MVKSTTRVPWPLNTWGTGMNGLLIFILAVAMAFMPRVASAKMNLESIVSDWRAQWHSNATIDISLLDRCHERTRDALVAHLAKIGRSGLGPGTDPVEASFALYALSEVLDGAPFDAALLTALESPDAVVRQDAASGLAMVWERKRVACTAANPRPSHCPGIGIYYLDDGVGTFVAEVQKTLQRTFSWPLLVNLRVMRSIAAVLNEVSIESSVLAARIVDKLLVEPDVAVQQVLGHALNAYVSAQPESAAPVLQKALQDSAHSSPSDLDARLVRAVRPISAGDISEAMVWINVFDKLESEEALPALGLFVAQPSFSVSWQAASAANWITGKDDVIPAWIDGLASEHAIVRWASAKTLGALARGLPDAVIMQIGEANSHTEVVIPALTSLLEDREATVKQAALDALEAWVDAGDTCPIAPFVEVANDPTVAENVRATAVRIIARLDRSAIAQIELGEELLNQHRTVAIYQSGKEGYHTFRIPAVIVSPQGTVLAFAEGRRLDPNDSGDIDMVLKRSTDGGLTWGPLQVIWDSGPHTSGNPVPVVDAATGRIWLFMTHNLGHDTEAEIVAGTSEGIRTIWVTYSDDDGLTWAPPKNLFDEVQSPDTRGDGTGPGIGIQLRHGPKKGRIVIPAMGRVIYSDDHGETWQQGGRLANTNESQVVELSDGRLLRNDRPATWAPGDAVPSRRAVSISKDQGATWGPMHYPWELINPYVQGSIVRYVPADTEGPEAKILIFANPAHETDRVNMSVWASMDDGESWPAMKSIYSGPSAYSSLTVLPNGSIGLLFEGGSGRPYENLYWTTFSLEWLLSEAADTVL